MARAIAALVEAVRDRSGGRCEAVWATGYRCRNRADEIHHRLPRARARIGDEHLLDLAGDTENLADLCRPCHATAHGDPARARLAALSGPFGDLSALRTGIVIDGEVRPAGPTDDRHPVYLGSSLEYAARYPGDPRR